MGTRKREHRNAVKAGLKPPRGNPKKDEEFYGVSPERAQAMAMAMAIMSAEPPKKPGR